jgi:hypothetical protein
MGTKRLAFNASVADTAARWWPAGYLASWQAVFAENWRI